MLYTDEEIKKKKAKITKIKNIINVAVYIILIPLLIYNTSLIIQAIINPNKTPSFLGIKTYVIISGSMKPEIDVGDIVIAKNVEQDELKEGDIISFRQGQSVVTHRILEKTVVNGEVQYKTKGDNNNIEDGEIVKYDSIEGKIVKTVPFLGKIALALQGKMAIIIIIIISYIYLSYSDKARKKKANRRNKRLEYEEIKNIKEVNK